MTARDVGSSGPGETDDGQSQPGRGRNTVPMAESSVVSETGDKEEPMMPWDHSGGTENDRALNWKSRTPGPYSAPCYHIPVLWGQAPPYPAFGFSVCP